MPEPLPAAIPASLPSAPARESERSRNIRLAIRLKRLLEWHKYISKEKRTCWPRAIATAIILGLNLGFFGGWFIGGMAWLLTKSDSSAVVISVLAGLVIQGLVIAVTRRRLQSWRETLVRDEHKLSAKIKELAAEFPQECQRWGGYSSLHDAKMVQEMIRELETSRNATTH
jgi:hypothetical protein